MFEIKLNDEIEERLDDNDYSIVNIDKHGDKYVAELETYSPEGEDVIIDIFYDGTDGDFIRQFREYANDFDPDEHAEMWVEGRGKNGVPESILDLINDAQAIKDDLLHMADILEGIDKEEEPQEKRVYTALNEIYQNIDHSTNVGSILNKILINALNAVEMLIDIE